MSDTVRAKEHWKRIIRQRSHSNVRFFEPISDHEVTKIRELFRQITKFLNLTLQELIEETSKKLETWKLRQTIIDKECDLLPADLKVKQTNLGTEKGLILGEEKTYIPKSLR